MGRHEPLTLSLDEMLDISFADELLSHFDLKRDSLHSPPNASLPNDMNHKHLLTSNKLAHSTNSNDLNQVSPLILPSVSQHQGNNLRQDSAATNVAPIPDFILSPEENPSMILNTTLPASLTSLELPGGYSDDDHRHQRQQHGTSLHSTNKVKAKSTTASLPGTIADRANRRRQGSHGLLRRSSTYLRQKFFAAGGEATEFPPPPPPPPLPTLPTFDPLPVPDSPIPNDDNLANGLETTVASNYISNDNSILSHNNNNNSNNRTKTTSPLSPPPTPPSSCTPIIPSSTPLPPSSTNMTATTTTPVISPSQYPPKPLQYCPVDPPNDRHRASFPIFSSWRKKSLKDPRRQSEPTITSQHIKTRRSFFFL